MFVVVFVFVVVVVFVVVFVVAVLVFVWRTVVEIFLRFLSETNMPIATNRYKPV